MTCAPTFSAFCTAWICARACTAPAATHAKFCAHRSTHSLRERTFLSRQRGAAACGSVRCCVCTHRGQRWRVNAGGHEFTPCPHVIFFGWCLGDEVPLYSVLGRAVQADMQHTHYGDILPCIAMIRMLLAYAHRALPSDVFSARSLLVIHYSYCHRAVQRRRSSAQSDARPEVVE